MKLNEIDLKERIKRTNNLVRHTHFRGKWQKMSSCEVKPTGDTETMGKESSKKTTLKLFS